MTQFRNASARLVLAEKGRSVAATYAGITETNPRTRIINGTVAGLHGTSAEPRANVLLLDGHVETMPLQDVRRPAVETAAAGKIVDPGPLWGAGPG